MTKNFTFKTLFLLFTLIAGNLNMWAEDRWVLVTDYSSLSTTDTYVIAGNVEGGTTWYSLKNNKVESENYLPYGSALTIADGIITSTISDDETWVLIKSSTTTGAYYIKSTKGAIYLQNNDQVQSYIKTKNSNDNRNLWYIHYKKSHTYKDNNTTTVTGLYNIGTSRMLAVYGSSSSTDWRCHNEYYFSNIANAEVVLYKKATSVNISPADYATFSNAHATDFSGTGVKVYKAKAENNLVKLTEIANGIVPANTGVILYKDVDEMENITIPFTTTNTNVSDNEMVAAVNRTYISKSDNDGFNYIMQSDGNGGIVFKMATTDGAYLSAGKAYLSTSIDASANSARLKVAFDDEASDIKTTFMNSEREKRIVYDLQGRRLNGQLKKGMYIVNDKKVVIK